MLGQEGEPVRKTIYPMVDDEDRRMVGFDLDHPLSAAQRERIGSLSSRIMYLK